jgi:DNA-binding SARP family transcriptional activator
MEFCILGPLAVGAVPAAPALRQGKPRAVLAMLLLHANQPVSVEQVAAAVWGEDAPVGAARTVHVYISRLRKALGGGDRIATTPAGYRLRVEPGELDLERFEQALAEGRRLLDRDAPARASELLRGALGLWRGPPLEEFGWAPFAPVERRRLEELERAAVELRVDADLAAGRHTELVPELQGLTGRHPWREHLHAQLLLALYRSGRQAEALEAYRRTRKVLVEELGIEPGASCVTCIKRSWSTTPAWSRSRSRSRRGGSVGAGSR